MSFDTPLRYPGGKGRLTNYIAAVIRDNDLIGGVYAEPFAGGAGMAISLLLSEYVRHIYINDIDRYVYAFWYSVIHHNQDLRDLITETPVTMEQWHLQREIQQKEGASILELGFSTFFLNRTNRSGILNGGVIGGLQQNGEYKLDARFNKLDLSNRIRKIGNYAWRIHLTNLDAREFIQQTIPSLPANSLIYFDPPYFVKGQKLYENHFTPDDHAYLAHQIVKVNLPWLVSYDNVSEIAQLYESFPQKVFSLNYSAQKHYEASELMIFSERLKRPEAIIPTRASLSG